MLTRTTTGSVYQKVAVGNLDSMQREAAELQDSYERLQVRILVLVVLLLLLLVVVVVLAVLVVLVVVVLLVLLMVVLLLLLLTSLDADRNAKAAPRARSAAATVDGFAPCHAHL